MKNATFVPLPQVNYKDFLPKQKEGQNNYQREFLKVIQFTMQYYKSFSVRDAYRLSLGFNIPADDFYMLFDHWQKAMIKNKYLKLINGGIDENIYSSEV